MFIVVSALLASLSWGQLVSTDGNAPPSSVPGTAVVLDSFGDDLFLLASGAEAGLRQGQKLDVAQFRPTPRYLGRITLMQVGTYYSVAHFKGAKVCPVIGTKLIFIGGDGPRYVTPASDEGVSRPLRGGAIIDAPLDKRR
jgi:hypothetical protein